MTTYNKGKTTKLSKNFNTIEFDCKGKGCCSKTLIEPKLIEQLQKIRNHFGKPITINSGYRCSIHNKAVGGTINSKHTKGMAADIKIQGVKPLKVAQYAESIGIKGIGLYDTFTHVDTRTKKAFWYSSKQEYRSTFGGLVKEWQKAAQKDGFLLASGIDGVFGKESEKVAKKAVCRVYKEYKYTNLTKIIQKKIGVNPDGKFGEKTKIAVEKWQKQNGLKADGIVGFNTWKKILNV